MRRVFNNLRVVILMVSLLYAVVSCREVIEIDSLEKQLFLEESVIGTYKDGHEYIVYNPDIHQMAINPRRHTFRIQTDRQNEYFHLRMESYPRSLGVNIIAEFDVKVGVEHEHYSFVFECSRIEEGKIWLWNKENKLGVILPEH